jgi:DNA-binding response OmpR family regulator
MARILIMEDDKLLRDYLSEGLASAGHSVNEACDGKAGIDLFHTERPDIVLTDLVMEDGEGIESIMSIRQQAPLLPIIAMSGNPKYLENSAKLGATHTLLKPFHMVDLLTIVDHSLGVGG